MILPLAVIGQLAATCAPQVAPQTIAAIVQTESRGDALAIHDNTDRRSYAPQSKGEAIALARRLYDAGHNYDSGITQINNRNLGWLGLTLEDVFDPCKAMGAAAALLTSFSRYNTGSPTAGFANGYVRRVLTATADPNSPRAQHSADPRGGDDPPGSGAKPVHQWNAFPDPAEDSWNQ